MSKVDDNKKQKESTLLETAFHLFTGKGFAKTTISDIVQQAGLAKGTFYLYFKDKYDLVNWIFDTEFLQSIRDKLIVYKANQLFDDAHRALEKANVSSFEDELLFTTDYIIERFQKNHFFMEFIAKNLSWGIFKSVFTNGDPSFSSQFYDHYMTALKKYNVNCPAPELLLFTMIELIGSTSYNCIHNSQPVSMEEYLPYLHRSLHHILLAFTE